MFTSNRKVRERTSTRLKKNISKSQTGKISKDDDSDEWEEEDSSDADDEFDYDFVSEFEETRERKRERKCVFSFGLASSYSHPNTVPCLSN